MTNEQIIWINQIKQGNELAAYQIYQAFSKAMYNTLIRITGNNEIAKDLLQDGFVRAFKNIHQLDDPQSFAGWIKRIMVNIGLEYIRKKKVAYEIIDEAEEVAEFLEESLIDDESIHRAIKELPDGCRTVFCLYLLEGYKHAEIADELGISESTSKTQLMHAKKLMKQKLEHLYAN